jgi:hypothetical protein
MLRLPVGEKITQKDFEASGVGPVVAGMLIDMGGFYAYENREQTALEKAGDGKT